MSKLIIDAEKKRGEEHLKKVNSFIGRNYWMWIAVAYVIYPLAAIVSAITEGTHIHLRLAATLGDSSLTWVFTIAMVVLIESLKFFTGKGAVDDWQANAFIHGGVGRAMFIAKCIGFVAVSAFSYNLSTQGADMATHHITRQTKPPAVINKDSINSLYDSRLAPIQANIESYRNTTWKGSITRDALSAMRQEGKQVEQIEADRRQALAMAMQQDSLSAAIWASETTSTASFFTVFAGIGEFICFACLLFIGLYDQGVLQEVRKTASSPTPSAPQASASPTIGFQIPAPAAPIYQGPPPATPGAQRRPIGFYMSADTDQEEDTEADNEAIVLQHVATTHSSTPDHLDQAWKAVYRTYQAYFREKGTAEANTKGRATLLAELERIEEQMQANGMDVATYIRRRETYAKSKTA